MVGVAKSHLNVGGSNPWVGPLDEVGQWSSLNFSQVIEGCSAGRFEHGPSFGRFDCDYRDVCSRVYRLEMDSYLYHDTPNQQMLVYAPDNITPATHVSTCT